MATAVSICSNALLMLGDSPINSFDEGAETGGFDRARTCKNLWPSVRDFILRSHPWNCALKRDTLSPETASPKFGFSHSFILPGDWLRNHEINGAKVDHIDYVIESGKLLMDGSTCNIRYIWKNESPETWDSMLTYCAELAVAARMAYSITKSLDVQAAFLNQLKMEIKQARAVDGQDEQPQTLGNFEILTARQTMNG